MDASIPLYSAHPMGAVRKFAFLGLLTLLAGCAARPPQPAFAPVQPAPPPPAPPPRIEPPGFTGLTEQALRARLGAPAFARQDGPTLMWRYDAGACHAFFFLTAGKVAHIETIPAGTNNNAADPACLNALKKTP